MRFFDKYTGFFRRIKFFYVLYNLFHLTKLKVNKKLYKKYGLNRPVWFSLSSKNFEELPQLDLSKEQKEKDSFWEEKGFYKWNEFLSEEAVDQINSLISGEIARGTLDFNYSKTKILFAYKAVKELREIIYRGDLMEKLGELLGAEVIPFQSINFIYGSEQNAHSDSIHMSTYPRGGLIAIWIALDDIEEDNGPLFYYPGSHHWPYASNEVMGASIANLLSPNPNKLYEDYIDKQIESRDAKPSVLEAKKGDAIIWHANLVHGGMPHQDRSKTRRSMVIHYFRKDVICYHEISQRPAILEKI